MSIMGPYSDNCGPVPSQSTPVGQIQRTSLYLPCVCVYDIYPFSPCPCWFLSNNESSKLSPMLLFCLPCKARAPSPFCLVIVGSFPSLVAWPLAPCHPNCQRASTANCPSKARPWHPGAGACAAGRNFVRIWWYLQPQKNTSLAGMIMMMMVMMMIVFG